MAMLRNKRLYTTLILLVLSISFSVQAQTLQRFVKTSGDPGNTGLSWSTAMDNLQEAINSLHQEMLANGITQGAIYVAAGKYNPTESTEAQNSNILNTSFLIYDGITIYGGYPADPQDGDSYDPADREMKPAIYNGNPNKIGDPEDHGEVGPVPVNKWEFKYETILSGNHTTGLESTFTYNNDRAQYNTRFPSSSFHVVWFATKGAIDNEAIPGRYWGLATKAGIDGCIIQEGYASSRDLNGHNHMGFGGGVYMVKNSFIRNCIVRKCQAAQRGGGIYMDGGGEVDNCFIYECQTTGVAIAQGYGGGVCIDYNGSIKHSYMAQNTARIGGGLAICHSPGEYPSSSLPTADRANSYSPFASACVIANNSTNAEAGGVYLDEGGTINHCTVVKNNCIGPDITYYGRRHGRSGGIYVRNCGSIYNSVFWGNKCQANNDMQFASIRQSSASSSDEIDVYYSAFYNQDITDWSNVTKEQLFTLTAYNRPHRAESEKCCWFELNYDLLSKHGAVPEWWDPDSSGSLNNDLKAGVDYDDDTKEPKAAQILTTWRPRHASYLAMKGVQVSSTFHLDSEWIRHAHVDTDILGKVYQTVSTLGAVAERGETYQHALIEQQGEEGRKDAVTKIPTLFVYSQRDNIAISNEDKYEGLGEDWNFPIAVLADAVSYFEQYRIKDNSDPNFNKYKWDDDDTYYPAVQILIKEGTITTAGQGTYENNDIRTAAIRPKSNMRFYGGYPKDLTDTDTSGRNPSEHVTLLSSNIVGQYNNNTAHGFGIINAQNVIIDGVRMAYGNIVGMETTSIVKKGTGIILSNTTIPAEERIDMTGNELRNSVIANTQAYDGSAIYVNSATPKADNSITRSELLVKNTVIRNCTTIQNDEFGSADGAGVIVANGNAQISIDHCTIVNNVGYPLKTQTSAGHCGEIVLTNSVLFANSRDAVSDRNDITNFNATLPDEAGSITGHHNMFDRDATKNAGLEADETNQYILEVSSSSANYPVFKNPSSNVGHSEGVDRPLYGGTVSYEPLNRNPIVNAADDASMTRRDRSDIIFFNYGGAADLGAIENTNLPKNGMALYVTQNGAGKMDGSSWANAIAGNLVYRVGDGYVVDEVNGDKDGKYVTTRNDLYRGGYALDYVFKTGQTTYIDKQTVTQKRINLTYDAEGNLTSTEDGGNTLLDETENTQVVTESNTLTRQKTEYIYGEKSGASRNFYRTNLKDSQIASASQTNNNNNGYINMDKDNAIFITNNRTEDYVSGLQFAVEKAAELNRGKAIEDRVQVWVGSGIYEDYKGFVMRDKVEVFGGFPTTKYASPGMDERHALVSEYIPLSKVNASLKDDISQYETILQVIDKKPFDADTWGFNKDDVILYTDKDYTESGNKSITTTSAVTIPVYYRRDALPAGGYSDYYEVKGGNVQSDCSDKLVNPSFEQNAGTGNWSDTKAKNGWTITNGSFILKAGTGSYISLHGGAIKDNKNGFEFYQDVNGLEPGLYRVSCQGFNKGGAVDAIALFANGNKRTLQTVSSSDATSVTNEQTGFNLLAAGKYDNNWVDVYVGVAGHLRLGLKGTYTANNAMTVFDNFRLERLSGSEDVVTSTTTSKAEGYVDKKLSKTYSTFRKPVLYMPDVCMTTLWPGTIDNSDNPSNTTRWELSGGVYKGKSGTGMEVYTDAHWDGFTIRHGFIYDYFANRDGGAGVRMFEGGTLESCVVVDNANMGARRQRGGGGYCDGRTSKVVGCFFVNNLNSGIRNEKPTSSTDKDTNGGGIYLIVGTCYNSLFANNVCWGDDSRGAGIYIEQATFYNNTVAYNTCHKRNHSINTAKGNGVHQYEGANGGAKLNVFNTLFYGNTGPAIGAQDNNKINGFKNCYIKSATSINGTIVGKMVDCILDNAGKDKDGNPYTAPNPFEKGEDAPSENNYRLLTGSYCINKGMIPEGEEETFPKKDVDFADRVQDCRIDIGAYEYNGAVDIAPDVTTFADQKLAVYYVTENGVEAGNASANSPGNAACYLKLQKVLDAAGRWKYKHAVTNRDEYADFTPVVALAGNTKDNQGNLTTFKYMPERSTKSDTNAEDNVIDYSLIIPHGVQLWGGFTTDFYETDGDGNPVKDGEGHTKMLRDPLRYPTYITGDVVSSTGAEGQAHHVIHFTNDLFDENEDKIPASVSEGGQKTYGQLAVLTDEKDRAVLDGLFIINGYANGSPAGDGSVTTDMNGAAAIVTGYAHVRNCVITNNRAMGYGGGLYLEPHALVSGCIIKNNEAQTGGGVFVAQPESGDVNDDTHAFLLTSTVVYNKATQQGGGLVFDNNLRANSCIFWHNTATDKNNVSGQQVQASGESSSVVTTNYPMVYCGIEVVRWEGVNNLLVSANDKEGVRWDYNDEYYENYNGAADGESLFYPIEMSSVLSRAGMTYNNWEEFRTKFPTLELTDISGMKRMENETAETVTYSDGSYIRKKKDNSLIEMGARVVNASFEVIIDEKHIMRRLYVVHTEDLNSDVARKLQDNGYVNDASNTDRQNRAIMYSQMGSCFANPFHRLGDALEYVMNVRKSTQPITINGQSTTVSEYYKDIRFEIFLTKGTFYPYRNAYGMQAASRSNTFVIPEMVSIIGGVDNSKPYGQDGYGENTDGTANPILVKGKDDVPLTSTSTSTIRRDRQQSDLNMNNVVEPWELDNQSILSGNVISGTETKNAYHVITCYPDADKVGQLPTIKDDNGDPLPMPNTAETPEAQKAKYLAALRNESRESRTRRTIIIDGVTVTAGLANDISEEDRYVKYQQQTYFRGGGILVDGNWDKVDELGDYTPDVIGVANRNIPLLVTGCMFQDNMAANGGAIYTNGSLNVFGCHFAQNISRGPNTDVDQQFIPWTAGGAIATNYDCTVVNTIFANNEAKRGTLPITISVQNGGVDRADIRQGFGGVISASETSTVHAMNCDFVRNKAVAFPAIYNFLCQSEKSEKEGGNYKWERGDRHHWVVNSIFWGNEKNEDPGSGGQRDSYTGNALNDPQTRSLGSLFTVTDPSKTARKREDVANFGINDRSEEVLFFCAYEQAYGLPSELLVIADDDHKDDHKKFNITTWDDFEKGTWMDSWPGTWKQGETLYTHNQYLDSDNNAISGPNFIQPSTRAGADGYMQNADWLVSRLNRIIDNGWSYLPQHVTSSKVDIEGEEVDAFNTIFAHDPGDNYDGDGKYISTDESEIMKNESLTGTGIYNFYSLELDKLFGGIGMSDLVPLGEHAYMKYDQYGEATGMGTTMRRISTYPKQGEQEVFIDIGVYEYQYVQLFIPGNAYDVIWVRPDNPTDGTIADGTTWERATNNVQQAIDMLMSSHNDHDKVLKMRAGDYSPVYLTHGKLSFYIEHDGNPNTVLYPTATGVTDYFGIKSITIRGGYPNELTVIPNHPVNKDGDNKFILSDPSDYDFDGESVRNPELYPTRFIMSGTTGYENKEDVKDNLFIIQNMEMQEANRNFISADELFKRGYAVPVSFEGLTFSNPYSVRQGEEDENKQGAAILYGQQNKTNNESEYLDPPKKKTKTGAGASDWEYEIDGRPKLLIKDCIFLDNSTKNANGTPATLTDGHRSPTVNIMGGGGNAVVVNSLFHSNGGIPLEGFNTKVINCTFALNNGQLTLRNNSEVGSNGVTGSVLHNSIIWRELLKNSKPYDFEVDNMLGKNNAIWNAGLSNNADANGNQDLADNNYNILHGPNFTNPEPSDPWQRDMHPRPSDRIMSKGNMETYLTNVPYYDDESSIVERRMKLGEQNIKTAIVQTVTRNLQPKYGETGAPTVDDWKNHETELAHMPRFLGKGLERGPFETLAAIQRVLYVDPIKGISSTNDGATWERAFGGGQLQNAIDAAGVYSATNGGQRAYVFVKGAESAVEASILTRDGVTMYGSVANSQDEPPHKEIVDGDYTFKETDIFSYINRVRAARSSIASTTITSKLRGVEANNGTMSSGFVLDGFGITNGTDLLTSAPVVLNDDKTLLRNCIFYSNHVGDDKPVVSIKNGLLYNSLLYGNNATTVVNITEEATGGVLNCTVVAEGEGQTAVVSAVDNKVVNTITYNNASKSVSGNGTFINSNTKPGMFAPYLHNGANAYNYPFGTQEPLWYQLHEDSECINGGTNEWTSYFEGYSTLWESLKGNAEDGWIGSNTAGNNDMKAQKFIDFTQDRDILGNPRLLFNTVDRGAFETWRITDNATDATELTNETETTDANSDGLVDSPIKNYGGHTFPHVGSVVYIGENASLLVKAGNFNSELNAIVPGYLLLKKGASFYGQGNHIRVPYVATEHAFAANQQYALFSLPYDWDKANVISLTANTSTDALTQTDKSGVISGHQAYDGNQRSQWGSSFNITNSPYWKNVDKGTANEGYLLSLDMPSALTLRFTAWGINENGASVDIYTENDEDKVVELTQYNSNEFAAETGAPRFTNMEDMGWNLKGQPWLVNSFKTYATDGSGSYDPASQDYGMDVPHLIYKNINIQTGDNNNSGVDGDLLKQGQFISGRSWTDGATLELGSAFFTQTAIIDDTEELTFKRPVYRGTKDNQFLARVSITRSSKSSDDETHNNGGLCDDVVEICPEQEADAEISYHAGSDGLKWYALNEALAHIYVPSISGVRLSLVSKAPVEVEIPLGVTIPEAGEYTIALPSPQAYSEFEAVWLIDHQTGTSTNLLEQDYVLNAAVTGDINNRLTLKFGKAKPEDWKLNTGILDVIKVTARNGRVPLSGIGENEQIRIYNTSGVVVFSGPASQSVNTHLSDGVYIIKR